MNKQPQQIAIIGNGIAGITAAREVRKQSDHFITVISAESEYFFSRTALMYVYMGHMKFEHTQPYENDFWQKNRINLVNARVKKVDPANKQLLLDNGGAMAYDKLVIAAGSVTNKFDWPGQDLQGVTGLYSKQDLEYVEQHSANCKRAVVVGGGLIGIEITEMLHSRNIPVTLLVREPGFWGNTLPKGEAEMINRHIREHHVDLRLMTRLKEIIGDENGRVKAVITDTGEKIECQLVALTAGVSPNIGFLQGSGIELGKGVLVNRYLETNIENIYAIGDCAEQREAIGLRKPVESVWYTGRIMGETLANTLCGNPTAYAPGHWFNSAKFFDIEYQTYGWVWAKPKEDETHFYWEHPSGKKAIRLAYQTSSRKFLGINCFGIRMRQQFFEEAMDRHLSVDKIISQLKKANFDPEFYTRYEKDIQRAFQQFHTHLSISDNG